VRLHSLRGDVQLERDLLVEVTPGDQTQRLALAHRELVELGVDLRRDLAGERVEHEAGKAGEKTASPSRSLRTASARSGCGLGWTWASDFKI
jgi:hypothetical protein